MIFCPNFEPRNPSHPNHGFHRCKPLWIGDRIAGFAAIPWVMRVYSMKSSSFKFCLMSLWVLLGLNVGITYWVYVFDKCIS